jgi:cell division protein FtsA
LEVAEIIEARMEEIFEHVTRELKKINRDGKLPAGAVFSGGGSKLPGLLEFSKKQLRLPVQLGTVQNVNTIIDQVNDPSFSTACGLILWGNKFGEPASGSKFELPVGKLLENQNVVKLRKWFKSFLP